MMVEEFRCHASDRRARSARGRTVGEGACRRRCQGGEGQGRRDRRRLGRLKRAGLVAATVSAVGVWYLPGANAMAIGLLHSCAVIDNGSVKCWGNNIYGQVGQLDNEDRGLKASDMGDNLSSVLLGAFEVSEVAAGEHFSCALSFDGQVKCWGRNNYGQLGLGDTEQRGGVNGSGYPYEMGHLLPTVDVGANVTVESLALGASHSCAVTTNGELKCWGWNNGGQLGLGNTSNIGDEPEEMGDNLPFVDLGTGVSVSSVTLGRRHTCALVNDGDVKCWGNNNGGQLGYEDTFARGTDPDDMGDELEYVDLGREQKALAISAGAFYTCALLYTGDVKCWGYGTDGQLGQGSNSSIGSTNGTMGDYLPPIDLGTDRKALALATGGVHACAVLDDSSVKCWGGNSLGSLGLGDNITRGDVPGEMGDNLTEVALTFGIDGGTVSNIVSSTMSYHTCVAGTQGEVACYGSNQFGQLGAGLNVVNIGDDPGEVEALIEIDLGTNVTVVFPEAVTDGSDFVTISPTPVPTMPLPTPSPTLTPTLAPTVSPEPNRSPVETPFPTNSSGSGSGDLTGSEDSEDDSSSGNVTIGIVSAAVLIPIVTLVALYCCWRRRKQNQRFGKAAMSACVAGDSDGGPRRRFSLEDGSLIDIHSDDGSNCFIEVREPSATATKTSTPEGEAPGDAGVPTPASPASGPTSGFPTSKVENTSFRTLEMSGSDEILTEPALATATAASAATVTAAPVAVTSEPSVAGASVETASDDDDSSWGARSEAENPGALRRTGSNSSISTLDSTSTASSTWPSVGFVTPARADIPRGGATGGRVSGRGRGHVSGASISSTDSFPAGIRTPLSHAGGSATPGRMEPDTPSPRSGSGSVHGTPHPPEMRLAQFARASAGGKALHGLPEMEVGRSPRNVFESNSGAVGDSGMSLPMPLSGGDNTPLTTSSVGAVAIGAGGGGGGGMGGSVSPEESASPTMMPTLTPARVRHAGDVDDYSASRRASGRQSNRSSGTTSASPLPGEFGNWVDGETAGGVVGGGGGVGMGPEAAAQAFAEEAELEALQIDKNDLKLVFGRPFARGKSSEVYQVTHEGRNRAAKIIDLFSLGVVGEEVTRLYACFAQELRAMKGIRHDCVAVVYGAVATPSELTIVTDLVKRGPLRAILDDKARRESLKPTTRHKIIKDVSAGMAYLSQQGIEHRNLHSRNVLITKEWGAKVTDYGLARTTGVMLGAHDRSKGKVKKRGRAPYRSGTLRWTAPELLRALVDGMDPFTEASDVYSFGIIVWEMLCGGSKLPYDGVAEDKVKSMILEGSTPPVSMETPLVYSKLMLLCWRMNPSSRPTFSHIESELLKDPPEASS